MKAVTREDATMKNTGHSFAMAVVMGSAVDAIVLVCAMSSYSQEYAAGDLFPEAGPSTHVLLVHTKLVKDTAGSEVPIIQEMKIQRGRFNYPRSQPVKKLNQDQSLIADQRVRTLMV